jgi:hypothetical protein
MQNTDNGKLYGAKGVGTLFSSNIKLQYFFFKKNHHNNHVFIDAGIKKPEVTVST